MEARIQKLQKALFSQNDAAEGYLITSPVARRYLLGFSSTAGTGLILENAAYFIVDFRYYEMACHAIQGCKVLLQENMTPQTLQAQLRQLYDERADYIRAMQAEPSGNGLQAVLQILEETAKP